jgi:phosphoribosylformylglycinamidine synthase
MVGGIGGYGNCVGVPTVAGECIFHRGYDGNILVNTMTVGLAQANRIFYSAAAGGTRSSTSARRRAGTASTARPWRRPSSAKKPTRSGRRSGSAIRYTEKLLIEACLELVASGDDVKWIADS